MKTVGFIPARYGSTRLPGKPLLKINEKTIIQMVYEKAKSCKMLDDIIILTDDLRIKKHVEEFSGKCEIILEECLNGTERIVKFLQKNPSFCDLVVNIQGDEPFFNAENVDKMIKSHLNNTDSNLKCTTLHFHLNTENVISRSVGKLILDKFGYILYCSRNPIPSSKTNIISQTTQYLGHIGLFVFDKKYLLDEYLTENTPNQISEDIEWLKILEQGYKIKSLLTCHVERGIDTPEDYKYLKEKYEN